MMPVATRRSQAGGVSRKPPPSRKARGTRAIEQRRNSESWDYLDHEEDGPGADEGDQDVVPSREAITNGDSFFGALAVNKTRSMQLDESKDLEDETPAPTNAMDSLREMAERVGKEVEHFAEQLDQFVERVAQNPGQEYELVLDVVEAFHGLAAEAAEKMEREHRKERAEQLRREWSDQANVSTQNHALARSGGSVLPEPRKKEKVLKQRKWQKEADLWDLFYKLTVHHHEMEDQTKLRTERDAKLTQMGSAHRFTSEQELWERFLLVDDVARERDLVKQWLEQTVEHQESDIPGIMEDLEAKAGRGKGLWSSGWIHTREQIKHQKRVRVWPEPDADPLPELRSTDKAQLLATSLDPDAPSRQDRTLEKSDAYFERAMWIACWEMLRRGKSWAEISEWCRERNEGWRAIAIGKASDPSDLLSSTALRRMAFLASQSGASSDYEAAVYGLLGGNMQAVQKACLSVDDHLFAHYSVALVRQFDQYLVSNFPDRASRAQSSSTETLQDPEQAMTNLLIKLRNSPSTKQQALDPMKIIQSYLILNDIGSMIHTLGYAISYSDQQLGNGEQMIIHLDPFWSDKNVNQPEEEIALDPDSLRIAAHMSIVLDILSPEQGDRNDHAAANVTIAYIQALRAAGKRDLIPIYATRLSRGAYTVTMAKVLQDITSPAEQISILKLMEQYNLDVMLILNEQIGNILDTYIAPDLKDAPPMRMLEPSDERVHPGQRIRRDFLPDELSEEDAAVVAGLRWFTIVEKRWADTFNALSLALRKALIAGHITLALAIVGEFPYDSIAIRKSYQVMGRSLNPMELVDEQHPGEFTEWQLLRAQSRTYYELELLVNAIKALSNWREHEAEYTHKHPKLSGASPDLKEAREIVGEAIEPVLKGKLILNPKDEDEAADLDQIRIAVIPDLVLGYNIVLHAAGHLISRDNMIDAMDLSVIIADETNMLSDAFVRAGRMRELVDSFAHTSKSMLVLKAEGKKWRGSKGREGKDLGIWEVGAQGVGSGGLGHQISLS